MLKLSIRANGQEHLFETDLVAVTFGRSPDCTIQVSDQAASRLHCRLEQTPQGWRLVDLESSNGTSVNGRLTNAQLLKDGDVISIGAFSTVINPVLVAPAPVASQIVNAPRVDHVQRAAVVGASREKEGARGLIAAGVLSAALLAGGAWAVNHFYGASSAKVTEQRNVLGQAEKQIHRGDLDGAEKSLVALLSKPVHADVHKKARTMLDDVRAQIAARDAKYQKEADAAFAAAEAARKAAEFQTEFDYATAAADALVVQECYGPALDVWKRFAAGNTDTALAPKIQSRMQEVLKAAQDAWETLENRANSLVKMDEPKAAMALVGSSVEKFQGTRYAFLAQDKLAAINRLAGGTTEVASAESKLSARAQDSLLTVEDLVKARRYSQALRELDGVISGASAAEKAGLDSRRAEIATQAALFDKLVTAVNAGWFKSRPIDAGSDMSAFLVKADDDGLGIDYRDEAGRGGMTTKRWHQIAAEEMVDWFRMMELSLDEQVALAAFCYSNGMAYSAAEVLHLVVLKDASRQDAAFQMVARHRGIPVPAGGFVWYEGGFYGQDELKYAKLEVDAKKGASLIAQADPKKANEGYELYRRVMADQGAGADLKSRVTAQYVNALKSRRTALIKKLQDSQTLAGPVVMREMKKELNRRRDEALRAIFDRTAYSDDDKGASGQAKVDAAVAQVRELWDNPVPYAAKSIPAVADVVKGVEQSNAWLREMGAGVPDAGSEIAAALAKIGSSVNLREYCMTAGERALLDRHKMITAYNDSHAGFQSAEKECIRSINEYRFMMGRAALEAHDLLGKAAREHAADMVTNKYFAHESALANKKTPADRCRVAGYPGGGIGENIGQGSESGSSVFGAWLTNSTYHRNMLNDLYTQVGAGTNGTRWVADFGRGGTAIGSTTAAAGKKESGKSGGGSRGSSGGDVSGGGGTGDRPSVMGSGRRGGVSGGEGVAGGSTGGGSS